MADWLAPVCRLFTPQLESVLGVLCAVLAGLLLVAIALGFGPLRAWLGVAAGSGLSDRGALPSDDGGLLALWRLYRQSGRAASPQAPSSWPSTTSVGRTG